MSEYDRKFCSTCQAFKPLEGGLKKQMKSGSRWICRPCVGKIFKSPKDKANLCAA